MAIESVALSSPVLAPKPSATQDKPSPSVSLETGKTGGTGSDASKSDSDRLVDIYA